MNIHAYISFLACTKVRLWDLTVCIAVTGDQIGLMPNIELVRVIFIYYNVFKFQVPRSISF